MKSVRIVLADDHALVRAGIRSLLERIAGVEVVGEADSGVDALTLIRAHRPDVAFLDIVSAARRREILTLVADGKSTKKIACSRRVWRGCAC